MSPHRPKGTSSGHAGSGGRTSGGGRKSCWDSRGAATAPRAARSGPKRSSTTPPTTFRIPAKASFPAMISRPVVMWTSVSDSSAAFSISSSASRARITSGGGTAGRPVGTGYRWGFEELAHRPDDGLRFSESVLRDAQGLEPKHLRNWSALSQSLERREDVSLRFEERLGGERASVPPLEVLRVLTEQDRIVGDLRKAPGEFRPPADSVGYGP